MFGNRLAFFTRSPSFIGSWRQSGIYSKPTTVKGISHETIICESVIKNNATQSNNALTTKKNCHIKDPTVTEVTPLANTLSKSGLNQTQQLAWKDDSPKVTQEAVNTEFDIRRRATDEEDANFQRSKNMSNNNYSFRKPNLEKNRFYEKTPQEQTGASDHGSKNNHE